ncbi:hypothetical protein GCM10011513_30380 [Franconibacter daqui]|nr:hypothetical protein GCM10011513_30380 [Franconibacter daqui]
MPDAACPFWLGSLLTLRQEPEIAASLPAVRFTCRARPLAVRALFAKAAAVAATGVYQQLRRAVKFAGAQA